MSRILGVAIAMAMAAAFSGIACAQAVKTENFSIDAAGNIKLTDSFREEINCVLNTIEPGIAEAAGAALAANTWPANVDHDFQVSRQVCTDDYDWSEREGQLAIIVASTQTLIKHSIAVIDDITFDHNDVVDIEATLSDAQVAKFRDGTWLQDAAMLARLQTEMKAHGLKTEKQITTGEVAVGAFANQNITITEWIDLLNSK